MSNISNMYVGRFINGNLKQWKLYKYNDSLIWLTGDNLEKKYQYLINKITANKNINKMIIKKLLQNMDDHFGVIYLTKSWSFAAVDFARTYPIFWKRTKSNFVFSPQAKNIIDKKKDSVDSCQLMAFRMSGYTIDDGTLWENVKNLNPGHFIFIESKKIFYIEEYFSYKPWIPSTKSYVELKAQLKNEINTILKNTIIKANGRTIVIPLSAGLDSRLIASGLKYLDYKNVKCFSYGLKNNFESKASRIIANKLGFSWKFIEINQQKAKNFYSTIDYKNYMNNSHDGCATSTIQGLYAVNMLLKDSYLLKEDLIINGNSGDFISGGHVPKGLIEKSKDVNLLFEEVFEKHFIKHYALWQSLLNKENKIIIKEQLFNQLKKNIKDTDIYFMAHGMAEFLEYQNRQTKYVINAQRIYEFYNLKWQLPLWDKSFIKFWSDVPLKYKINQKLYKDTLIELNMGGVWSKEYDSQSYISPKWMRFLRTILKAYFLFIGKNKWHNFEKKYLEYWMDNICGQSILPYLKIIRNENVSRHYVSWLTIFSENLMLNSNWQNIDIDQDYRI